MTWAEQYDGPSTTTDLAKSGIGTVMTVTSSNGVRFHARLIRKGDRFGRDDVLTVGEGPLGGPGEPMVEFYDARYVENFTPLGQFVSRYYVSTILETEAGVNLQFDVPDWTIDADTMRLVRAWLRREAI